jgi:DNA-binding winged helix-turn-helix (wHTH) protein/Tol biopolymer transport system component
MTKQYWIGGFFIEISRNQITQNKHSQTIAPKALAVLTYLAENQGKVVSHDALLDKVWPNTVVSPNTLQRSIAQLRKALGDDGKIQTYIKTHAKQGYSLECDVRWHDHSNTTDNNLQGINKINKSQIDHTNNKTDKTINSQVTPKGVGLIIIIALIIIFGIIGNRYLTPKQDSPLTFDQLRLLTATDDKEFDASYTPDGQYIVFHRYLDKMCVNHIWAKNIITQKEIQLTKNWGSYGRHSFSKDGKKLVFLATEACNQPSTQKNCYDLVSLDFEKSLENPQEPNLVLQCQNSIVKKPIWLNNNDVALKQKTSDRWKLIIYSISNNQSTDLFELKDGNLIDFAYSVTEDLFAVMSVHNDGQHYIEMLKPDGTILSSHPIEYPPEIPKSRPLYPNFDPLNKQLIFSTGRQLFTLSYDGKITKINTSFIDKVQQPEFHSNGKKVLMIKGPYDSDVVKLPLNQINGSDASTTPPQLKQPYASFERTNLGEEDALFQPAGEFIAFWSERSGDGQIWISDDNGPQQLTQFPMDTYIQGFNWAADGKSLLVNANDTLTQVFLDSSQKSFPVELPVIRLFQWDSNNNTALLKIRIKGVYKFVEYDLNKLEIKEIIDKPVLWGLKSKEGLLIYKDYKDQFWQPGPVEDLRIKALDNQPSKTKSFVIYGNVIYAINTQNHLWSYNLNTDEFKVLADVGKGVDNLSDVNQTHILMTIQVAAKKEVVELFLRE